MLLSTSYALEVPRTSSSGSINLLECSTELKETFDFPDSQLKDYKEHNWGTLRWKRCTGWGVWKAWKFQALLFQHPHAHQPGISQNPILFFLWRFYDGANWLTHGPSAVDVICSLSSLPGGQGCGTETFNLLIMRLASLATNSGVFHCVYSMEYYTATKRNEIVPSVTTWVDPENIILSEMHSTQKDEYSMISFIHGI